MQVRGLMEACLAWLWFYERSKDKLLPCLSEAEIAPCAVVPTRCTVPYADRKATVLERHLMSSRMAFSDCSTSSALAGCSAPLYPPSLSLTHPAAGSPTASTAAPTNKGGLDVTCTEKRVLTPQSLGSQRETRAVYSVSGKSGRER